MEADFLGYKPNEQNELTRDDDMELDKNSFKAATTFNHKFNARHNLQAGLIYTRHSFDFYSNYFDEETNQFVSEQDIERNSRSLPGFCQLEVPTMGGHFHCKWISCTKNFHE